MSHGAHHEGHGHGSKAKKKKGTKFPVLGIVAWWLVISIFAFSPVLGFVSLISLGFIPSMTEVLMYPFEKLSELEDKKKKEKKEGTKKNHAHTSHH